MNDWPVELHEARRSLRISQRELAGRTGLSVAAIGAYERGQRHPRRAHLVAIIEALQLDRGWRNRLLSSAGFAPDGLAVRPPNLDEWMFTPDEAAAETEHYRWPAFVLSERGEVLSANASAQRLWGVDLEREFADPLDRIMLSIASNPRFADRCVNWDQAITVMLSAFKAYHRRVETLDEPSPFFDAALQRFLSGDPKYVGRLITLWEKAPATDWPGKIRWSYPVTWDEPEVGRMQFQCIANAANEMDGLSFHDWIPVDGASWDRLDALALARRRTTGDLPGRKAL